ncbi:MAG: protein kinase [Thermomicrobiales bacterium]|nr:protein kinase [Thermomicrobiales bacterium]
MAVDTLLDNRYAIHDHEPSLGEGGMAVIYAGTDTQTDVEVAAKTLLPAYQGDAHRRARFRNEANVLRAVQNPHVVDLVDVIDGRRGTWIVMERLQGESLRDRLKRQGPAKPDAVAGWLTQVAAGLEEMHRRGYVHLDVTPQNIFLGHDGMVKLIDFGIAQEAYRRPQREGDKLLGTATYISPEHGSGRDVTPAADVYSLGCVVFELLTGKKVFSEHDPSNDATIALRQDSVPELPTSIAPELRLPEWVDTVVAQAIMPNPAERYPSATAFAEAFAEKANPPLLKFSWPRRSKPVVTAGGAPTALIDEPVVRPQVTETVPQRNPSRMGAWLRKEWRNTQRALAMFALMIALILGIPAIGGNAIADFTLGFLPGSDTTVVNGNWNLRASANTASEVQAVVQEGDKVQVTGAPKLVGTDLWWPVESGDTSGWVHDDALKRTWLMNRAAGYVETREDIDSIWNTATGWLPG